MLVEADPCPPKAGGSDPATCLSIPCNADAEGERACARPEAPPLPSAAAPVWAHEIPQH